MNHVVFTIEQNPHVSRAAWLNHVVQGSTVLFFFVFLFLFFFLKESLSGERCIGEEIGCKKGSEKIAAKIWSRIIKELK